MTDAESIIWYYVRAKRFLGLKFKRQVLIGEYIVDFLCPEKMLIVEIDGGQHNEIKNVEYDTKRTNYLESNGYKVVRYWNNEVLLNIQSVLDDLKNKLDMK